MTQILFVDDEPMILRALERVMRVDREFQTLVCGGGDEALSLLDRSPVDIIVSDLHMPGMDGITLLEQVRQRHPGVARFVLSGQSNHADALRAASVAHQFLPKPINSDRLRRIIGRVMGLRAAVTQSDARAQATWLRNLPTLPRTFGAINMAIEDRAASTRHLAALVEGDSGLSAKILQVVNGAYFGQVQRVASIERAVMLLGTNVLKALVLAQEIFQAFPVQRGERMQELALRSAALARRFAFNRAEGETAFTAALLHDVGRLVTMTMDGGAAVAMADGTVDHAAIGASLLALWGLPDEVVDAVAHHHHPAQAPEASRRLTALVHVATALAKDPDQLGEIDVALLDDLGMAASLPDWRLLARAL